VIPSASGNTQIDSDTQRFQRSRSILEERFCEPVSVSYRTGLRLAKTEIGKWPPETCARKPPIQGTRPGILAPETRGFQPKPREGRRFSHTWKPRRRDRTGWLGRQDSNLGMAESKSLPWL
jgi:hypothetical protein